MTYTIEKNVAVPTYSQSGKWTSLASKMGIGDSVYFNDAVNTEDCRVQGLREAGRRMGFKMISRTVNPGVRVWRVEP